MKELISNRVAKLRQHFASGVTLPIEYRIGMLCKLRATVTAHEQDILQALWSDLHKSPEEAYLTEYSIIVQELDLHIKRLRHWAKPQKVSTPIHLFPSKSHIYSEPLGVALIMAPWNYPFQLIMNPLIGAISSGCCAMMKPSPMASATANIVEQIIRKTFDSAYIDIVQGHREVNTQLLEERYDFIFFTGSPMLGKVVYQSAAKNLTPVILELGGKSPCIIDKSTNISLAAKRIAWGKWLNAGQTCIAPDYILVEESIKDTLLKAIKQATVQQYGENIKASRFYPRIVNDGATDRLSQLIEGEHVYWGGEVDRSIQYIAPTILDNVTPESPIMQDEIFGPILPVMTFKHLDEALQYINKNEKPLALYYFGKHDKYVLRRTSAGGTCVNDTIMHITNHNLPFGGVGNSGMGKYHAHESFKLFSNQRAVVKTSTWIDLPFKYAPFKYFKWIKRII